MKSFFKKIIDKWDGDNQGVGSAAFILGATALLSGLLGLLRDRFLAGAFGAGDDLDIYYAAFRLPDLVYGIIIFGPLSASFIPIFTDYLKKKDARSDGEAAWYFANNVIHIFLAFLILFCGFLVIFAPGIVVLLAPGFSPAKMAATVTLTRLFLLEIIFLGASNIFGSILQSFRRFLLFSLSPIMYNLGIIFGVLVLAKYWGLVGVATGVILGAFLHFIIQWPAVAATGYRYRFVFNLGHEGFLKILKLAVPRSVSVGLLQINYFIVTAFASSLAAGSLAIFSLASNLVTFPEGIVASSLVLAVFPTLCQAANEKNWPAFRESFSSTIRQIMFLTAPLAVFLVVFGNQIVRIILESGKFSEADTVLTVLTLKYFVLYLIFDSLMIFLIRAFFSLQESLTPTVILILVSLVRLPLAFFWSHIFGVWGLALAYSLSSIVNVGLLWFFLRKKIGRWLDEGRVFFSSLKIMIAAVSAGWAGSFFFSLWGTIGGIETALFWKTLAAGLAASIFYVGLCWLLKLPEVGDFGRIIKERFIGKKIVYPPEMIENEIIKKIP